MSNTTRVEHRRGCLGIALLGLTLGLALAPAHAQQNGSEPQAMPQDQTASQTLSIRQQAIPLIAASMAVGDMPRLKVALNTGLTPASVSARLRKSSSSFMPMSGSHAPSTRWANSWGWSRSGSGAASRMRPGASRANLSLPERRCEQPARPIRRKYRVRRSPARCSISSRSSMSSFNPIFWGHLRARQPGLAEPRTRDRGALAATPGVESQLRSHMAASIRVGLSPAQLRQLSQGLEQWGDTAAADRARGAGPGACRDEHPGVGVSVSRGISPQPR